MFNYQLTEPQSHQKFNYTTTYLNVVNITTDSTYSCVCACDPEPQPDPCGIDISVGCEYDMKDQSIPFLKPAVTGLFMHP